jgi:hypothetical protein
VPRPSVRTSGRRCPRGYITGAAERDSIYVHGPDWYAEQAVELRLGRPAVDLDPAARSHELRLGSRSVLGGAGFRDHDGGTR